MRSAIKEQPGKHLRRLRLRLHHHAAASVALAGLPGRAQHEGWKARFITDLFRHVLIHRNGVAKTAQAWTAGRRQPRHLRGVPIRARLIRMADTGEHCEVFTMILESFQIGSGHVVAPGFLGEKAGPIDAEAGTGEHHTLWRHGSGRTGISRHHRLQKRQCERHTGTVKKGASGNDGACDHGMETNRLLAQKQW